MEMANKDAVGKDAVGKDAASGSKAKVVAAGGDVIDKKELGHRLRKARLEAGYPTAEEFVKALKDKTGVSVSKQTVYNIESGKQEPKLSVYLAMQRLTHPGKELTVDDELRAALPATWKISLDMYLQEEARLADSGELRKSVGSQADLSQALREIYAPLAKQISESLMPAINEYVARQVRQVVDPEQMKALADALPVSKPVGDTVSEIGAIIRHSGIPDAGPQDTQDPDTDPVADPGEPGPDDGRQGGEGTEVEQPGAKRPSRTDGTQHDDGDGAQRTQKDDKE